MELIKRKSAPFDGSKFVDGYEVALRELVEAKVNNAPVPQEEPAAPARGKVINLMDALRKSIGGDAAANQQVAEAAPPRKAPRGVKPAQSASSPGISLVKKTEKASAKSSAAKSAKTPSRRRSA